MTGVGGDSEEVWNSGREEELEVENADHIKLRFTNLIRPKERSFDIHAQ